MQSWGDSVYNLLKMVTSILQSPFTLKDRYGAQDRFKEPTRLPCQKHERVRD